MKYLKDEKGFSILEILIGVAIFMVGMLGVAGLQISSINNGAFSANVTEATMLATSKIEELMYLSWDDVEDSADNDGDADAQDVDGNGVDDDDEGTARDGTLNFGLDDTTAATADDELELTGRNNRFNIYWNVAENHPLPNTKTIKVHVLWSVKKNDYSISMEIVKEELKS